MIPRFPGVPRGSVRKADLCHNEDMHKFRLADPKNLRSRSNRGASESVRIYEWAHPWDNHCGVGLAWTNPQCWLRKDLNELRSLFGNDPEAFFVTATLAGHLREYLEQASLGELSSKEATACKSQPGVAEIRLPIPYRINSRQFLVRLYYGEPAEWGGMVSLCLGAKENSDNWKEQQNVSISLAQNRGESWLINWRSGNTSEGG